MEAYFVYSAVSGGARALRGAFGEFYEARKGSIGRPASFSRASCAMALAIRGATAIVGGFVRLQRNVRLQGIWRDGCFGV